jgi:hypothetical protein
MCFVHIELLVNRTRQFCPSSIYHRVCASRPTLFTAAMFIFRREQCVFPSRLTHISGSDKVK